jgi:hypothetical protein
MAGLEGPAPGLPQRKLGAMRVSRTGPLSADHPDFFMAAKIEAALLARSGGITKFKAEFPKLIRQAIDEVIDTPRTGRVHARELEKTEKTYIGTKIEILVRNYFRLPKGILDLKIEGMDVDVKNTLGNTWMIPREAVGKPCILVASDEDRHICFFGIMIAHLHHLTAGLNQDQKRSVARVGFAAIHWLMAGEHYPSSFWSAIGNERTHAIMRGLTGNERIAELFRSIIETPIHRDIIQAVAQQKDYMKRLRKNGGARDVLAKEGIAILSGKYDSDLIRRLSLSKISTDEFISIHPEAPDKIRMLRKLGRVC